MQKNFCVAFVVLAFSFSLLMTRPEVAPKLDTLLHSTNDNRSIQPPILISFIASLAMDFGGVRGGADGAVDIMSWYMDIPVVSRLYLTGAFLTTAACAVDIITPFSLYFNWDLIFSQGQFWRLITSYLFFGVFSIDFLFHMYFLVRYSRLLEEGDFRGRTANFVLMLIFGVVLMTLVASYVGVHFLGSALTFMMVYVWGRRNDDVKMSFLGFFTFNAPYIPWVMLGFSVLLGNAVTIDLIGIVVGHLYYFLEYVYPVLAEVRGWPIKRVMEPPALLHWLCGSYQPEQVRHAQIG